MREISIPELKELMKEGIAGVDYAWEHQEELISRKHTYTLYGPHSELVGANTPSSLTRPKERQLKKTNRRQNYMIYELDDSYRILRTTQMVNYTEHIETFHHFEWNGVWYAYDFGKFGRQDYNTRIFVMKFQDGKPCYYADIERFYIFAEFYEYLEPGKIGITSCSFAPGAKYTVHGYPVDWNAPIGAVNSPVSWHFREEPEQYIDFSHWFTEE